MLWLAENYIRVSYICVDKEAKRVTAFGGIREKDKNDEYVYKNFDVMFSRKLYEQACQLTEGTLLKVTKGGVDLYPSTRYTNFRGKPLTMVRVMINDFELPYGVATPEGGKAEPIRNPINAPKPPAPDVPDFSGDLPF